eukprot:Amastigsp_a847777_56.p3 type:complete len:113 gc:universal Amastigsp_a847777_56:654-992(+)
MYSASEGDGDGDDDGVKTISESDRTITLTTRSSEGLCDERRERQVCQVWMARDDVDLVSRGSSKASSNISMLEGSAIRSRASSVCFTLSTRKWSWHRMSITDVVLAPAPPKA